MALYSIFAAMWLVLKKVIMVSLQYEVSLKRKNAFFAVRYVFERKNVFVAVLYLFKKENSFRCSITSPNNCKTLLYHN